MLSYRGSTLAARVTHTLLDAGVSGLVVVTRTELVGRLQLPDDPRVHVAINDDADSEMIDSIRIGLGTLGTFRPEADDAVVVVPGDMPALSVDTCRACIEAYEADPRGIVIASYREKHGHPIIFPFAVRAIVETLEGGLRMLPSVSGVPVRYVESDDPGVTTDVDTPADYEQLGGRTPPCTEEL